MGIITNNIIEKSLGSILSEVSGLLREVGMMGGQIAALIDEHGEYHFRVFLNLVFNGLDGAAQIGVIGRVIKNELFPLIVEKLIKGLVARVKHLLFRELAGVDGGLQHLGHGGCDASR